MRDTLNVVEGIALAIRKMGGGGGGSQGRQLAISSIKYKFCFLDGFWKSRLQFCKIVRGLNFISSNWAFVSRNKVATALDNACNTQRVLERKLQDKGLIRTTPFVSVAAVLERSNRVT